MIHWYNGMPDQALGAFQADAAEALRHGYTPTSQVWVGDRLVVTYAQTAKRTLNIARVIGGVIGGIALAAAGLTMIGIRSVAGNSIDEAFYQAMGIFSLGLAAACLGWAFS